MFASLLVANRGEIACRIIRTARALGIRTVAVHSVADRNAAHVRMADEAREIGAAPAAESYLRGDRIIAAARAARVEAIHPGYGFLSENPAFAEACAKAGIVFVGPPASAIRAMGGKDEARRLMSAAGVPVVPGYDGARADDAALAAAAREIGYPVLIKAAMGGGGRGMRLVEEPDGFADALAGARREAGAAFGNDRVIVEKLIPRARHIEIQIFADRHGNVVHLFERDCSLQRRHQKVVEEAPAPGMTLALRARMTAAATAAARAIGYEGAGTVELIVDASAPLADDTAFHFLEMNTRLQVEHPVTEMVTGLDLVEWQLRVAAGERLPATQDEIALQGHAVEARLYAEDPVAGFLPSSGRIVAFEPASGEGLRVDAGVRTGDCVTADYDPMIAKLIAHGPDRKVAIERLRHALSGSLVAGPETNQAFLSRLVGSAAFAKGKVDTTLIDRSLGELTAPLSEPDPAMLAAGARAATVRRAAADADLAPRTGPWAATDGFQVGPERALTLDFLANGAPVSLDVTWSGGDVFVSGALRAEADPALRVFEVGDEVLVCGLGRQLRVRVADPFAAVTPGEGHDAVLTAPMPGRIVRVFVERSDRVEAGAPLVVLEAMKMEHVVRAPRPGRVGRLAAAEGDQVELGAVLVVLDGEEAREWPSTS